MIWEETQFVQMLAYGNAEQRFFKHHRDLFDIITLPGTVATYFRQGAGGFVLALKKHYFIDPRTSVLQGRFQAVGREEPRHVRLATAHGRLTAAIFSQRSIRADDLTEQLKQEMLESILDFQVHYAESSSQKLREYLSYLGQAPDIEPLPPHWITPPYFRAFRLGDDWYAASLDMSRRALSQRLQLPVVPIVCIRKDCLSEAGAYARLADDWSGEFPSRLLWIDKLDGYRDPVPDLKAFLDLVTQFRDRGARVFNLFGDYFFVMAMKVGLSGVGHGVGYGESREALTTGGGLPAERYYVPALHRFYPPPDAEILLRQVEDGSFLCRCEVCRRHIEGTELRVSHMSREDLLIHFLLTRREEINHVLNTALDELIDELAAAEGRLTPAVRFRGVDMGHLARWRDALKAFA